MAIKAVAFDMDGTLFSSNILISSVYRKALVALNKEKNCDFPLLTVEEINPHIGKTTREIRTDLFPNFSDDDFAIFQKWVSVYFKESMKNQEGELLEGVIEMLENLSEKNILVLIASNGGLAYLQQIIERYNLPITEPLVFLNHQDIAQKKDILEKYLALHSLKPHEVIMVGDRNIDFEAAKAVNIPFIGLTATNYGNSHELDDAPLKASSIAELTALLNTQIG